MKENQRYRDNTNFSYRRPLFLDMVIVLIIVYFASYYFWLWSKLLRIVIT